MSRLDSFIRRLLAQRACLDWACMALEGRPGPVIELGLGNGRTYDHLRERLPDREIFVFERDPHPHPFSRPDEAHLIVGDLRTTLPMAPGMLPGAVALAHSDIGTGDPQRNRRVAAWLAQALPPLLAEQAIVVSDQALTSARLSLLALPDDIAPDRYFLYRHVRAYGAS